MARMAAGRAQGRAMFFVVSTQSTRVRTLGIRGEGDLLENFNYVLVLGKLAVNPIPGPDPTAWNGRPSCAPISGVRPVYHSAVERPSPQLTQTN
jgi:hypothetical protein